MSVCTASCRNRSSGGLFGEGRLGFGRFEGRPVVSPLDPEKTLPALLDERGVTNDVHLGVTPDGGPMEGVPVLEPLEHSVLEKSPVGGFPEWAPVLEPLEHSGLGGTPDGGFMEGAPVLEPLEHLVLEKALDRPMVGFAARDPEMAIRRDRLRCVVQYFGGLARTCVIDLYTGVSTIPVEIMVEDQEPDFLALARQDSRGRGYGYSPGGSSMTDLCFPQVSCSLVDM